MCSPIRFDPEQIVRKRRDTARISQLDSIINVLFEDRAVGRITPERFEQIYSNYEKEQAAVKAKLALLEAEHVEVRRRYLSEYKNDGDSIKEAYKKAYTNIIADISEEIQCQD